MKQDGTSFEQIIKYTELTEAEIANYKDAYYNNVKKGHQGQWLW